MGFLDRLVRQGTRAITNAVSDAVYDVVSDVVSDALTGNRGGENKTTNNQKANADSGNAASIQHSAEDSRIFDEKLRTILEAAGNYEIRRNISPEELEQEVGMQIYTRSNNYAKPEMITYGVYKDGQRVLLIHLWCSYPSYRHKANRQIKDYCDANGIKMLEFFDYMPNEAGYMKDRIQAELVSG